VVGKVAAAFSGSGSLQYADSVPELRNITGGSLGWIAILGGCVNRGDGGGGVFYWDSVSAPDDGGTILNSGSGNSAGWRRIYYGALSVRWFGASGAGQNDDTA
jgi:hypothetical protein